MKYMGFKLGPALKLNNHLEKLRQNLKSTMMNKANGSNVNLMPLKTEYNWDAEQDYFLLYKFCYLFYSCMVMCWVKSSFHSIIFLNVYIYESLSVYILLG